MSIRTRHAAMAAALVLLTVPAPVSASDPVAASPTPTEAPATPVASPTPVAAASPAATPTMSPSPPPATSTASPLPAAVAPAAATPPPSQSPQAAAPAAAEPAQAAEPESVHAEMLADHAGDAIAFEPGSTPEPRAGTGALALAAGGTTSGLPNGLFREVFGYLPYWMLGSADRANLDYSLLSTIAYFSVGAQANGALAKGTAAVPSTGWAGWTSAAMTDVINRAHARDVKVVLTVTMMAFSGDYSAMSTLLNSSANRARLAGEIASAVKSRNADGVNLDFEPVPASLRSVYTSFVRQLKAELVRQGAGSYLTVATMAGAASWSTGYDVVGLTAPGAADALMVMAYDFSWAGSARAGGVAPISNPYIFDVAEAIAAHLAKVPANKLIWGVPYYGREWSTISSSLNATTNSILASRAGYYTFHRSEAAARGRKWDAAGRVPWYTYRNTARGTWVQGYYDDVPSLTAKYDLVNVRGMRGIGIWHLGMDGARRELWNALDANFQGAWFEDALNSAYRADILWIANAGISAGCGVERFCPKTTVTREQMASFLARALKLPPATRDWFTDDATTAHQADINRVAQAGITAGCSATRFCPTATVTREQMASFLARALRLPPAATDYFGDDNASAHEADINRVAQAGITGGCAAGRYCPRATVTREQMAAFLHRALT